MSHRNRGAFTLVELLVVMVILAFLFSLAAAGVQRARVAARRMGSANNLKNIQLAVLNYEAQHTYFPPSWKGTPPDASGKSNGWSCQALLLPHLEQGNMYSNIDFDVDYTNAELITTADGRQTALSALRVPTYVSPSEQRDEPRFENGEPMHYPINYAVNCGVWFVWDPDTGEGGEGAFYPNSRLKEGQFSDGLNYTLGLAEVKAWNPYYRNAAADDPAMPLLPSEISSLGGDFKTNSGHTEWVDGRVHQIGFTTTFKPNTKVLVTQGEEEYDVDWTNQQEGKSTTVKTYAAVTARSYTEGGVYVSMMGGNVRFVSDEINLGVWQALSTRGGKEVLPSDENLFDIVDVQP